LAAALEALEGMDLGLVATTLVAVGVAVAGDKDKVEREDDRTALANAVIEAPNLLEETHQVRFTLMFLPIPYGLQTLKSPESPRTSRARET
jgi:hypothetical protein